MTKDVIDAIMERRSVRSFTAEEIPEATIGRLLDAARHAPTAGNIQAWHFYAVLNKDKQKQLQQAAMGQRTVGQAAAVIVVCALPDVIGERYADRGRDLYVIQDTAAAVQNILLAATGYGLGSCWIGAFNEQEVQQAIDLPSEHVPVAMVALGYTEKEAKMREKKAIEDITTIIR